MKKIFGVDTKKEFVLVSEDKTSSDNQNKKI